MPGEQLRFVVDLLTAAKIDHLVYQVPGELNWRVAIRDQDYLAACESLLRKAHGVDFYAASLPAVDYKRFDRWGARALAKLPAFTLVRYFDPKLFGPFDQSVFACRVERWQQPADGFPDEAINSEWSTFTARVRWEHHRSVIQVDGAGACQTVETLAKPGIGSITFPIDAVFTWVDDSDPQWRQRRADTLGVPLGAPAPTDYQFQQHDELRFALRAAERFAPWIRNFYLVTDQQRPAWLTEDTDVIKVVDHRDIWADPSKLPTFNSHAISSQVHHIDGLSEHYLLFNDDVFLGCPILPKRFFQTNGTALFHNSRVALPPTEFRGELQPFMDARMNALDLVERDFGYRPVRLFQHVPVTQLRSLNEELEEKFAAELGQTAANQIRSRDDTLSVWLHHYYGYAKGRTNPGVLNYRYIPVGTPSGLQTLAEIARDGQVQAFCINDGPKSSKAEYAKVRAWLESYYPGKSRFERD